MGPSSPKRLRTRSLSNNDQSSKNGSDTQETIVFNPDQVEEVLEYAHKVAKCPTNSSAGAQKSQLLSIRDKMFEGPSQGIPSRRKRPYSASSQSEASLVAKAGCSPTSFRTAAAMGDNVMERVLENVSETYYRDGLGDNENPKIRSYLWLHDKDKTKKQQKKKKKDLQETPNSSKPTLQDLQSYPTIGSLLLPVRRVRPIERWAPREIALFESAICVVGKQFHKIQELIKTKSTKEIIEFYYIWKKTQHYDVWKRTYSESG